MKNFALLTDFYELSMAYGYWQLGTHDQEAVFHLFFRRNPKHGSYILASGLSAALDIIHDFSFTEADLDYLKSIQLTENKPYFSADFLAYLKTLRLTVDVDAVSEGSVVFANEPVMRVKGSLLQCQLLETILINTINFSSAVSTAASRVRTIVGNDILFEFGLRRAQGPNGGLTASRAAYVGGFDATSNVLAGKEYQIPVVGTMAHSWVMAFNDELTAFRAYAEFMPENTILLVDTYNTEKGVDNAIIVGQELKKKGYVLKGIRLDSGDFALLSQAARQKLDKAGLKETKIYVSGDLTESHIKGLIETQSPIDGWGIGTWLSTSKDQPSLDTIYKLGAIKSENQWQYKLKCSENREKTSDPGILQVRRFLLNNQWMGDVIYNVKLGTSTQKAFDSDLSMDLLIPVIRKGQHVYDRPSISKTHEYALSQVKQFNQSDQKSYPVIRDQQLLTLKEDLIKGQT